MLVAELKLKVGPLSLPLWRTTEPHVVGFLRHNMRRRLLSAAMDRRKPKPIREWASAKLRELDRMEDMAEARGTSHDSGVAAGRGSGAPEGEHEAEVARARVGVR